MDTVGFNDSLAGTLVNPGEDDKVRSSKSGVVRPKRGAPPSSLSLLVPPSSRSNSPSKCLTSIVNLSTINVDTISPKSTANSQLPSITPAPLKPALRATSSSRTQTSNNPGSGTTSSRTVTFRHHLFQPAKKPVKATFQPRLSDASTDTILAFDFKSPTPLQLRVKY